MTLTDGVVFILLCLACAASYARHSFQRKITPKPKVKEVVAIDEETLEDKERLWEMRVDHIRSLTVPLEERQEVVGRIGALCSCMSREEMYMVFEYARTVVRTREGFDREVH